MEQGDSFSSIIPTFPRTFRLVLFPADADACRRLFLETGNGSMQRLNCSVPDAIAHYLVELSPSNSRASKSWKQPGNGASLSPRKSSRDFSGALREKKICEPTMQASESFCERHKQAVVIAIVRCPPGRSTKQCYRAVEPSSPREGLTQGALLRRILMLELVTCQSPHLMVVLQGFFFSQALIL